MARLNAEERRKQLLAAAREEFSRLGFEGARISEIAHRAEVNVALLYRYFPSKEQMFTEAIVEPLENMLHAMSEVTEGPQPAGVDSDSVLRFYEGLLHIFSEYLELFGVVLFTDRAHGTEFYVTHIAPFIDRLSEAVRHAGTNWPQSYDPALTTPMSVGMCWGVAMDAHFRGVDLDIENVAATLAEITTRGLLP